MRALVVYCHPDPHSFTAAVRNRVLDTLQEVDGEVRLQDLYAEGFDPVLTREERACHKEYPKNIAAVAERVADLQWCDTLIFVYPTWNHSMPAMLKGWLDRVLAIGVAWRLEDRGKPMLMPALTHIRGYAVFTTGGASRWVTFIFGNAGRRIFMRTVRVALNRRAASTFLTRYDMDSADRSDLDAHLDEVARRVRRIARRVG